MVTVELPYHLGGIRMYNSWNRPSGDVVMTGTKEELERRIKENKERGMVLLSEPKPVENVYVKHSYNYSTLHKPNFLGKEYSHQKKWMCKMRKPQKSLVKC